MWLWTRKHSPLSLGSENTVHFLLHRKTQSTFSWTRKHSPLSLEPENTVHFLLNQETQPTFSWTRKHSPLSLEPGNTAHFLLNQKLQSTFSWTRKHSPLSLEPENTALFQNHVMSRSKLLKNVYNLDRILRNYDDDHLILILLYVNKEIIKLTIFYLKHTERFD